MSLVSNFISRFNGNKSEFKEMQAQDRMQHMVQERKKSANEREMERILESDRQEQIKQFLEQRRKQETSAAWKDNSILEQPNVIKSKPTMLNNNEALTPFKSSKNKGGMFFK